MMIIKSIKLIWNIMITFDSINSLDSIKRTLVNIRFDPRQAS